VTLGRHLKLRTGIILPAPTFHHCCYCCLWGHGRGRGRGVCFVCQAIKL